MTKKFDATLKTLYEVASLDLPRLCGYPAEQVSPVDADTSIVSGAADKAVRVVGPPDWIMHIEFQSGPDTSLPRRMNLDNTILGDRTDCPVRSAVILLRRQANLTTVNGLLEERMPNEVEPYRVFRYRVIRLWKVPVEQLLQGGPVSVTLAPLANVTDEQLPDVIRQMAKRYQSIADEKTQQLLWTSTKILLGLTHDAEEVDRLLKEVVGMEESTTYQAIKNKGRVEGRVEGSVEECLKSIRIVGEVRFGPMPPTIAQQLEQIGRLEQLEQILARTAAADHWDEIIVAE